MPVVGFLHQGTPEDNAFIAAAVRKGLGEMGYVEGRDVAIEYRWARNELDRLPELAADLVRRRVTVIVTPGGTPATLAAKAATTSIPIVFSVGGDPVQFGLVASLNRPGGNLTGFTSMSLELAAKRLGFLHELLPRTTRFAALIDMNNPYTDSEITDLRAVLPRSGGRSKSSPSAPVTTSRPPLPVSRKSRSADLRSVPARFSQAVASNSRR